MADKQNFSKRYSDTELEKFKKIIIKKIESAEHDLKILKDSYSNASSNGTDDTYSSFKSFEEGSETLSKESNTLLASRQEKFIRDLRNALVRVENKTYGVCRETGKLISKDRLVLVPHATLCIEAKTKSK
jgi:DnaK suppressor protein|tara:strand:- start:513 stop:902 length:390 start_codon:yes stop_codon:yes gene_type:complete